MLYPKSNTALSDADFAAPSSEYRAAPFWAWNCALERDVLFRQIDVMRRMGMGGFHMHTRVGMRTPYLSDEFMDRIEDCAQEAERQGMLAYLYDEDKWPSGYAGGMVTCDARFRQRYLCFTPDPDGEAGGDGPNSLPRRLLAAYSVTLDGDGFLLHYERIEPPKEKTDGVWYAYLGVCDCNDWFNGYSYVNTLSKEAMERFVEVTHEKYRRRVGGQFGKTIPAIFTDEPQAFQKQRFPVWNFPRGIYITFTDDLDETFRVSYGYSLLDRLPELFWDLPAFAPSQARYHYHDHVTERFVSAFADTLGDWCGKHGLMLTGHMMEEQTLRSQTNMTGGEIMRSYRGFDLPGIDLLCDARELNTAKQCQSAAHQYGREGALSELYGVTGWDFPFCGHKLQGDWQAALGITLRVPHLYWVSMEGEAKRDYPASIGHQSPWYEEYPMIEDHFARLGTALTRGTPRVKVGVVHPIESYWLHYGPLDHGQESEAIERRFTKLTEWLLYGLVDFDFLCESLLPSQYKPSADKTLRVGEMAYDAVLVPGCDTLRSTTLDALEQFAARGGTVIFAGKSPSAQDAQPSHRPAALAARCERVPFERDAILAALEPVRELDIRTPQGERSDNLIAQLRDEGEDRWLFVCHCNPPATPDDCAPEHYTLTLRGSWSATWYDTLTGRILPLESIEEDGATRLEWHCFCHDSLLLRLRPAACERQQAQEIVPAVSLPTQPEKAAQCILPVCREGEAVPVTLHEPNALLLDRAAWRLDGGEWQPVEDILRIDSLVRDQLGLPHRCNSAAQPWMWPDDPAVHTLELRMTIASELPITGAKLAMEHPEQAVVRLGGQIVESTPDGWYVDEAIQTLSLPAIPAGETELSICLPFGIQTAVEWCYLLGDFGVILSGAQATLCPPVRSLRFGDIVAQGLPFYTGSLTYHCRADAAGSCRLRVSSFRAPVLRAALDGQDMGRIAFAPYTLELGALEAGSHTLDITAFGNRHNGFGPIHRAGGLCGGYGPGEWFTEGPARTDEYVLRPNGILTPPVLEVL